MGPLMDSQIVAYAFFLMSMMADAKNVIKEDSIVLQDIVLMTLMMSEE